MAREKKRSKTRAAGKLRRSARSLVLAILSREKERYDRKEKKHVRVPVTMAEAAKTIGVSVRTLRRWKNEGVSPSRKTSSQKKAVKRLQKEALKAERVTAQEARRDALKHPGKLRITRKDLPALPVGHRRKLHRYAPDKKGRMRATGETYDSSIVNYNVRGWAFREIAALVIQAWRAKRPFQFVYEVPAGGNLPKSGRSPERRVKRTTRAGTAPVDPYGFETEAEVLTFLNRYIDIENGEHSRHMVYVAIDDEYSGDEEDDE